MSNKQKAAVLEIAADALRIHRELDQSLAGIKTSSSVAVMAAAIGNAHTHVKNQLTSLVSKLQNLAMG